MIGSRTSMHAEFSTNFSTSHLTENYSIALPLKSWDEARYVTWAVDPVRSPDTCAMPAQPFSAWIFLRECWSRHDDSAQTFPFGKET